MQGFFCWNSTTIDHYTNDSSVVTALWLGHFTNGIQLLKNLNSIISSAITAL